MPGFYSFFFPLDTFLELYHLIFNLEITFSLKQVRLEKTVILELDDQSHLKFCKIAFTW